MIGSLFEMIMRGDVLKKKLKKAQDILGLYLLTAVGWGARKLLISDATIYPAY